jgi:hypothetical protein
MANPFPFTAGQVLTAAQMNGIGEAWTTFTPVWTASTTNPAIGNGTLTGKFCRVNKLIIASFEAVFGSTTTFGTGTYLFDFPVTSVVPQRSFARIFSSGSFFDTNTSQLFSLEASYTGTATTQFRVDVYTNATQTIQILSPTVPVTLADSDSFTFTICYEAA